MKSTGLVLLQLSTILLGLSLLVPRTVAQTTRERERELNEQELEIRAWNLRLISMNANKPPKSRIRPEQALAQVQKDFTRIQVLNRSLVFAIAEKRPLDLKVVSRTVDEIRKRSERLNELLALPEAEKTTEEITSAATQMQLKLSLLKLGKLIYSFTGNQFFKEPQVINTDETIRARRELLQIVELSAQIKKDSDRLEKDPR